VTTKLPAGWVEVPLDLVADVRLGRQRSPDKATGEHMRPYMRAANVTWNGVDTSDIKEMNFSPKEFPIYELKAGDILLSEASGSASEVGKPALWRNEIPACCFQNTLIRVRSRGPLPEYLHLHFLADARAGRFATAGKGIGINHLGAERMSSWPVRLPPLNEQRRIVAKLEALQFRSRRARESLDAVPPLLEKLRQSILAAACEGRLPGRRYKDRLAEPPIFRLDELVVPGGIFDGARDHGKGTAESQNLRAIDYTTEGVRVIRLENLGHLKFIEDKRTFISEFKYEGLRAATVLEDDVLFGSFVEEQARVCVLPRLDSLALAKADCFCVRFDRKKILPAYAALQLASRRTLDALKKVVRGATRPRITTQHLRALTIPVCSPDEQREVVATVKRRLAQVDSLDRILRSAQDTSSILMQATLAKAFRGELVRQDPSDEPAEALLARRQEKSPPEKPATRRRRSEAAQ
jgi:type I restriction enzyme, S subunit